MPRDNARVSTSTILYCLKNSLTWGNTSEHFRTFCYGSVGCQFISGPYGDDGRDNRFPIRNFGNNN